MNKELYRETEWLLYRYKTLVAEVENLKIAIEEEKKEYKGCSAITYEEKTAPTNKFNSTVENEVIIKDKHIEKLIKELVDKQVTIMKIDNALSTLSERDYEIINLKYFKKTKSWNRIGEKVELTGEYCRALNLDIVIRLAHIVFIEKYI